MFGALRPGALGLQGVQRGLQLAHALLDCAHKAVQQLNLLHRLCARAMPLSFMGNSGRLCLKFQY